jgi:hypothetical protein
MDKQMKRRLEIIEEAFTPNPDENEVIFIPLEGETETEYDCKIESRCAGEKVKGQERLCTGDADCIFIVRFVNAQDRQE